MKKSDLVSRDNQLREFSLIGVESIDNPKQNIQVYGSFVYHNIQLECVFDVVKTRLNKMQMNNYNSLERVVMTCLN